MRTKKNVKKVAAVDVVKAPVINKYVLSRTIHFGKVKTTFTIGTVFNLDLVNRKFDVGGTVYNDISDLELCIRRGWAKDYSANNVKIINAQKIAVDSAVEKNFPKTKPAKMIVIESDQDLMERVIPIQKTFMEKQKIANDAKRVADKSKVMKENSEDKIRGIPVLRQEGTLEELVNGEHLQAKSIKDIVKTPNKKAIQEASVALENRKKAVEQKRLAE